MNGYTRIPHELMRNPNLPPIAKVVWSLIAGMRPGFNATLSQYCKMVACHPNTWRSIVKMLELFGMVSVEYRANGVTYTAITDTSKWMIEGNKNCNPNKNCEGNKICKGEGNKNYDAGGNKNCDPSEEHITEEQKNNNIVVEDAHARVIANLKTYDYWAENMCKNYHLTHEQLCAKVDEFEIDMACSDKKIEELQNARAYFNAWLSNKLNSKNGNNQCTGSADNIRAKLDADAVKAMAALAAESAHPAQPTW